MEAYKTGNLLHEIPGDIPDEVVSPLCGGSCNMGSVRVDRIVSRRFTSPEGFWYDQDEDEYVLLIQGAARLTMAVSATNHETVEMKPLDWIYLPAHIRHRVDWTDPDRDTIWLAVYY